MQKGPKKIKQTECKSDRCKKKVWQESSDDLTWRRDFILSDYNLTVVLENNESVGGKSIEGKFTGR